MPRMPTCKRRGACARCTGLAALWRRSRHTARQRACLCSVPYAHQLQWRLPQPSEARTVQRSCKSWGRHATCSLLCTTMPLPVSCIAEQGNLCACFQRFAGTERSNSTRIPVRVDCLFSRLHQDGSALAVDARRRACAAVAATDMHATPAPTIAAHGQQNTVAAACRTIRRYGNPAKCQVAPTVRSAADAQMAPQLLRRPSTTRHGVRRKTTRT